MNLKKWTMGVAVLTLVAAPAFAEEGLGDWTLDENITLAGCNSCGDSLDCGNRCGGGCGDGVCGGGLFSGYGNGVLENLSLARAVGIDGLDIGGWTQFGYHDSFTPLSTPGTRGQGFAFNDVPKDVNLQQQYFYIGKEADGSHGLGLGFRADFMYGTDAQKTQSFGNPGAQFDNSAAFDHGIYGWAIPQLYGEVAIGDLSVIVGKFYTPVGYEAVPATANFFYSRSLTSFNTEPFTHTGVLSTYTGFEGITFYNGWTLGWDSGFSNSQSGSNYIGGFAVDLTDDINLTYISTYGNFGAIGNRSDDDYMHSVVIDVQLTDRAEYVFQSDYRRIKGAPGGVNAVAGVQEIFGINQYLFYDYNDYVRFGSRIEWWRNDGVSNYEYTSGVNIKLLDNLVLRPELRKDWVPATGFDQDMVGVDAILTY